MTSPSSVVGRFAPSPTGPLHLGSLVAAVGSWLSARQQGGRWIVRMEDLDTPRVVRGSADAILEALRRYGLEWDGEVVDQSQRTALYEDALRQLREIGAVFDCGCSRADLARAASAPAMESGSLIRSRPRSPRPDVEAQASDLDAEPLADTERVYPGTCRDGLPPGRQPRAIRFRVPDEVIAFDDRVRGHVEEHLGRETGDFVVRRADGVFAYQLAVVVDDAAQGMTEVVRGGDLLTSTARQIALQRALGLPTPSYAHLPLVVNADRSKLGKRDGALPLPSLDGKRVTETLALALRVLGVEVETSSPGRMLDEALRVFDPAVLPATFTVT